MRSSKEDTPPDKRRTQGVDSERPLFVRHTKESRGHLDALRALWGLSDAETVRRALDVALTAERFSRAP